MTTFKISRKYRGDIDSKVAKPGEFSIDALKQDDVFGVTAFTGDSTTERDRMEEKMSSLRDTLDWKSEVTVKSFSSKVYGEGYSVNIMAMAPAPKATEDDLDDFLSSLAGSVSI
jgi:hypothetical protein